MKLNKLLIAFLGLLLLVGSVHATSHEDYGADYDYASDDSYSDSGFYINSDPNQWIYSKVDWEKVNFNRAKIYSSYQFYKNIPDDRYGSLDYKRIDYSQIQDHRKVDSAKYFKEMGCASCLLDRGLQTISFSPKGITHPNGNFVSVPGTYPPGSLFIATKDKIEVFVPEGAKTISVQATDTVTLNTEGRDVTLLDGTTINGRLSYDKGKIIINDKIGTTINGLKIVPLFTKEPSVGIYFDGNIHGGLDSVYVSMDIKTKKIIVSPLVNVQFSENNPFINIEPKDKLSIYANGGFRITVENRDSESLVPAVRIENIHTKKQLATDAQSFIITNGGLQIDGLGNRVWSSGGNSQDGSTPMALTFLDNEGNNLIGTETEPKKILINNYNELVTIPSERPEGYTVISKSSSSYAPSLVSERLSVNYQEYSVGSFKKEFNNIDLKGELDSATIKRITETLRNLPPQTRDSIAGFEVFSSADWGAKTKKYFGNQLIDAYTSGDRIIRIPKDRLYYPAIYHEAAHDLIFRIKQEEDGQHTRSRLEFSEIPEIKQQMEEAEQSLSEAIRLTDQIIAKRDEVLEKATARYDELKSKGLPTDATLDLLDQQIEAYDLEYKQKVSPLVDKYNKIATNVYNAEKVYMGSQSKTKSFASEWESIAGDVYDKKLRKRIAGYTVWADGSDGPRVGIVKPYGASGHGEDIATFVENVYGDPDFYIPLIDSSTSNARILKLKTPGGTPIYYRIRNDGGKKKITEWSPDQVNWMELNNLIVLGGKWDGQQPTQRNQEIITSLNNVNGDSSVLFAAAKKNNLQVENAQYDARYRQKIDLLYQKGFITKERYDYITRGIK